MPQQGRGAMPKDTTPGREGDTPACPVCGRPRSAAARPFCSRRCADLDLGRWLTGAYAVPAEDVIRDDEPETD